MRGVYEKFTLDESSYIVFKKDGKIYIYILDGHIYEYDGIRSGNEISFASLK